MVGIIKTNGLSAETLAEGTVGFSIGAGAKISPYVTLSVPTGKKTADGWPEKLTLTMSLQDFDDFTKFVASQRPNYSHKMEPVA